MYCLKYCLFVSECEREMREPETAITNLKGLCYLKCLKVYACVVWMKCTSTLSCIAI